MSPEALGFDDWFQERFDADQTPGTQPCRVISVHKNSFIVSNGEVDAYAEATGRLVHGAESPLDLPVVGDWVQARLLDEDTFAVVHDVFPRKTILARKAAGKHTEFQPIAANIDTALIVQSLDADFNIRRLERYLAMVAAGDIEPVVLLSKRDLASVEQVSDRVEQVQELMSGILVLAYSSENMGGLDEVKKLLLPRKTFCLIGSSGVGKTTILNLLMGEERFETGSVRSGDSKGRHVTTSRQLVRLATGALIIDTPGMRELGNIAVDSGIEETFEEIASAAQHCRFNDCTHTREDGCAVLEAVHDEVISRGRYDNYMKMKRESDFNEMTYLEKRSKDKAFGKMIKSVMKQKKKRNK